MHFLQKGGRKKQLLVSAVACKKIKEKRKKKNKNKRKYFSAHTEVLL